MTRVHPSILSQRHVFPAHAGIQKIGACWIPAHAGVTEVDQ